MGFIALKDGKRVTPHEVSDEAALECVDCGEPMHVVSSHPRAGTLVVRHFRHNRESSSGSGGACGGGESDLHERVKGIALDHLKNQYVEEELFAADIEIQIGERVADAAVTFNEPQLPLGHGIAIEVQYRNIAKDIEEVEQNHLEYGYSVMWVNAENDYFPEDNHRVELPSPVAVWPNAVPKQPPMNSHRIDEDEALSELKLRNETPRMTIQLPPEHYELWEQWAYRNCPWKGLFSQPAEEKALAELDLGDTNYLTKVPFHEWLKEPGYYRDEVLKNPFNRGINSRRYGTESERRELGGMVHRIVTYNTGGPQPESCRKGTIMRIATGSETTKEMVEAGITNALTEDLIERTDDGRYRSIKPIETD